MKRLNIDEIIKRSIEVHGRKYDYSNVLYKGIKTKICILCKTHGEFWQSLDNHLHGQGCPKCGRNKLSKLKSSTKKEFIKKAKNIHGSIYDYSDTQYISAINKICIICKKHGKFWQRPSDHIRGKGCSKCGYEKISISKINKKRSIETRKKLRFIRIEQISKNKFNGHQIFPSYNPIACQLIDEYGRKYEYNFQHAMNGGEYFIEGLGYWVDGYDKEKNTVIEYYEKWHNKKIQKDLDRENEIRNYLKCNFIVLHE